MLIHEVAALSDNGIFIYLKFSIRDNTEARIGNNNK